MTVPEHAAMDSEICSCGGKVNEQQRNNVKQQHNVFTWGTRVERNAEHVYMERMEEFPP